MPKINVDNDATAGASGAGGGAGGASESSGAAAAGGAAPHGPQLEYVQWSGCSKCVCCLAAHTMIRHRLWCFHVLLESFVKYRSFVHFLFSVFPHNLSHIRYVRCRLVLEPLLSPIEPSALSCRQ